MSKELDQNIQTMQKETKMPLDSGSYILVVDTFH